MVELSSVERLIRSIEWMPKIEVIIYAALNIKRCSHFFSQEKLERLCKENNYSIEKFYQVLKELNLEIKKDFFIAVSGWPDQDDLYEKFHLKNSCRADDAEGMFLDIPECCAVVYAKQGNIRDRKILLQHPFRGARMPEQLDALYPTDPREVKKYWEDFGKHLADHGKTVFDHTEEVKLKVEKMIKEKRLPGEICLLFSAFIPCQADCKQFMTMANDMNGSLVRCLRPQRYREIIEGYKNSELCL
jgi:hypothetical protein